MTEHDAQLLLIQWMRSGPGTEYSSYGYDVYVPNVLRSYVRQQNPQVHGSDFERLLYRDAERISPVFYAAAWELCRRGILRPGVNRWGAQATDDGSGGNGYSITPFGSKWLGESERDDFVPTEPERFGKLLEPFRSRFGPGFHERAQEAIRCYGAHAYLACCAMCGAAAESVLLATASSKKSEVDVFKLYTSGSGRGRVEKLVIGQAPEQIRREFLGFTLLLKYWRDEAAHGRASSIKDNEAYTSLALLLRFAGFVHEHWKVLTARVQHRN